MSIIQSIDQREKGLKFINLDYDIALLRLKCYTEDVYRGIAPSANVPDFNPEPPVFACRFASTSGNEQIIALANEDGKIALQDTNIRKKGPHLPFEGTQAHCDAIFDIAWMPQEMKLITASGDHTARLWDVSLSSINELQVFHAHTRSLKCSVFRHQDKAVFATGGRDGSIMIWDIRANYTDHPKPDSSIYNAHYTNLTNKKRQRKSIHASQSVTGLAFQDDYTLVSCSAGDGLIKVWDLRKNYSAHKKDPIAKYIMNYGGKTNNTGFTSLSICPAGITLYASCMDNIIYAYNISSYNPNPIAEYYGDNRRVSFYVKACLSPDGKYLASGSKDELAYIWHIKKPGVPLLTLSGHRDEVTCLAWCSVGEPKIVTCSDDACHRIWRIGLENELNENDNETFCGHATPFTFSSNDQTKISLETTPTLSRTRTVREFSSESDVTPVNTLNQNSSEESLSENKSSKRYYYQISNSYWSENSLKSILSPIHENIEAPAKRLNIDNRGARRLFSPENKVKENEEKQLQKGYESDESNSSFNIDKITTFSPTLNLPNFVIDGTAPHLLEMSPQKSKENIDWLTKMRKERYSQRNCKSTEKASPKNHTTPVRRTSRSKSTEPQKTPKRPVNPLLQFLRPAIKDCNDDLRLESSNTSTCSTSRAD